MIKYPILFHAKARSISGIQAPWEFESIGLHSACAIPSEFEGPGQALSPEDLFAQALTNCFIATFKVYAEKSRLDFELVSAQSELTVDLDENKRPVMKKCVLRVAISSNDKHDRIKLIAEKAFASGFILNSVKTELTFELKVIEGQG